jgi:hypothetical protein
MKKIIIDKQVVNIPQSWDDLTADQFMYISNLLYRYSCQEIDIVQLQLLAVCEILNLQVTKKNSKRPLSNYFQFFVSLLKMRLTLLFNRVSRESYLKYRAAARECFLSHEVKEDLLAYNLIQIAKEMEFLNDDNFSLSLSGNPIKNIEGLGTGRKFNVGLVINTDITAGEYADIMDMVVAWEETKQPEILNYIVSLLYTKYSLREIIEDESIQKKAALQPFKVKYAVYLWYISISNYFLKHPVYSHLYLGRKSESEKITLGMGEALIRLSKAGYGSITEMRNKNLIEYMDIQVAELQESIRGAIAAGIEPAKLAEKTGRTLSQIEQLS